MAVLELLGDAEGPQHARRGPEEPIARETPLELAAASAHIERCAACRRRLAEMRDAEEFLRVFMGVPRSTPRPPAGEAASEPPAGSNDQFDGYLVDSVLDVGGQAVVYRARQKVTGRPVAIKVPLSRGADRASRRYRLRREIDLTSKLDHPAIVEVLGSCEAADGRLGCVMGLVDGQRFDEWAALQRESGRAGRQRIVECARQIAEGIAYAHQQAVLHRDLKPSNVLVDDEGAPHILDFGLAKALDERTGSFCTMTGVFVGTLAYSAPEQLHGGTSAVDVRTDVHGIGLLLYQALTGSLPWPADGSAEALPRAIRGLSPKPPTMLHGPRDLSLDAIVLRALAKDKDRRYQTAAALAADLRRWKEGAPVEARFDSRWYVARAAVWKHRWGVTAGAGLALVLLVFASLVLTAHNRSLRAAFAESLRRTIEVESHWGRVAEARTIARDNFAQGEHALWDLLLEPPQPLLDAEIEGPPAWGAWTVSSAPPLGGSRSQDPPTSPVYWALWETYVRIPVVASLPATIWIGCAFLPPDDTLVVATDGDLTWWNWREGVATRRLAGVLDRDAKWTRPLGSQAWILVGRVGGGATLVRVDDGHTWQFGPDTGAYSLVGDHLALARTRDSTGGRLELWDLHQPGSNKSPTKSLEIDLGFPIVAARLDRSGSLLAATSERGDLRVFEVATQRLTLAREFCELPTFNRLGATGRPDELIAWGRRGYGVIRLQGDGTVSLEMRGWERDGLFDDVVVVEPSPDGQRFALRSDRWMARIASCETLASGLRTIPAIPCGEVSLSPDGRHVALSLVHEPRVAIYDLAFCSVRRLLHPQSPPSLGPATVFDCCFIEGGSAILTVGMDGTVRRFSLPLRGGDAPSAADARPRQAATFAAKDDHAWLPTLQGTVVHQSDHPSGLSRIIERDGSWLLGTHDLGHRNAQLRRVRDGRVEVLSDSPRGWICAIAEEPGHSIWCLSGDGQLDRLDWDSGAVLAQTSVARHSRVPTRRAMIRLRHRGLLLSGPSGAGIAILDEDSLRQAGAPVEAPPLRALVSCPTDPDLVASTHDDGSIRLWRVTEDSAGSRSTLGESAGDPGPRKLFRMEPVRVLGVHAGSTMCAAFHPSGRLLATGGGSPEHRDVRIWDVQRGRELAGLSLFTNGVFTLAFSPDGRWLVAAGEIDRDAPEAGGLCYLIDLLAPERCLAGNLEHHIARCTSLLGRTPSQAEALRSRLRPSGAPDRSPP